MTRSNTAKKGHDTVWLSAMRLSAMVMGVLIGFSAAPLFATQHSESTAVDPDSLPHTQSKIQPDTVTAESIFGDAVAIDGDTLVVGAPREDHAGMDSARIDDAGAAYVFVLQGSAWVQQAKLVAEDPAAFAHLGGSIDAQAVMSASAADNAAGVDDLIDERFSTAVAISGDTVAVGAYGDPQNGINSGAVYIFVRSGDTWSQQAKVTPSGGAASDFFGSAVALDGDTLVVGAAGHDGQDLDAGAAYVFVRNGTSWSQQAKLESSDSAAFDLFGASVALQGDTVVVGASHHDAGGSDSGAAYVFVRTGDAWALQAKLLAGDGAAKDYFGGAVALDAELAVVSASGDDNGRGIDAGAAYIFARSDGAWSELTKLIGSHALPGDRFGYAVALDDQNLVIGARFDDDRAQNSGSAYLFRRSGDGWIQFSKYVADDGRRHDEFGRAVAVSGDWTVVGAPNAESIYAFERNPAIQLVTHLLLRLDLHTAYDSTPHPDGVGGVVSAELTLQNNSTQTLSSPSVQILHLRRGYRVITDEGPALTGSFVAVDFGASGSTLEPGEVFTTAFDVGIPVIQPFNFAVNAYAETTGEAVTNPTGEDTPPPIDVEIPGELFGIVPRLYLFLIVP